MKFIPLSLSGAYKIEVKPLVDNRGMFFRTFCQREFEQIGHYHPFVQMNHSITTSKATLRGMHFQSTPHPEIKLVKCIRGSIYDVIVDLRSDSPTYLQWEAVQLDAKDQTMLYIPKGFAHGFQTLENDVHLMYHHTEFYTPAVEGGVRFDDSKLDIHWPLVPIHVSDRDMGYPLIQDNFRVVF